MIFLVIYFWGSSRVSFWSFSIPLAGTRSVEAHIWTNYSDANDVDISGRCGLLITGSCPPSQQEEDVFLLNKKTCLLVKQEDVDVSSCSTRRHVFFIFFNRNMCLLVQQEDMSSCWARRHFFLFNKRTCLPVETGRHALLFNKKTRLLVRQEDMSSCWTRRHIFLLNKKTCLLVEREDISSRW